MKVGYCPQFDYLDEGLTVSQNIAFYGRIKGLDKENIRKFEEEFMTYFDMDQLLRSKVCDISEGQRRKLCSALTFIGNPKILFFDEPSTGMDRISRIKLWNLIQHYAKTNKAAILLTTHNVKEA